MVQFSDISVVIQGPILGQKSENYLSKYTFRCCESVKKHMPGSEIILSTWEDEDVSGLGFDILVKSKDPGIIPIKYPRETVANNVNRQIVSTLEGIKRSKRNYVLKLRSDCLIEDTKFVELFDEDLPYNPQFKFLNKRIVMLNIEDPKLTKRLFFFSDCIQFGLKEDLLQVWDIPLGNLENSIIRHRNICGMEIFQEHRYFPEIYIWSNFVKKYCDVLLDSSLDYCKEKLKLSEAIMLNNTLPISAQLFRVTLLKHPDFYKKEYKSMLYDYRGYEKSFNQYCGKLEKALNNLAIYKKSNYEKLKVKVQLSIYYFLLKKIPITFYRIRNLYHYLKKWK